MHPTVLAKGLLPYCSAMVVDWAVFSWCAHSSWVNHCSGRRNCGYHHCSPLTGGTQLPNSQSMRLTLSRSGWISLAWEGHSEVAMVSHLCTYLNVSLASSLVTPCSA